jgi:hypothetical protein
MDSGDPAFYVAPNPHRRGDMAPGRLKQPIKPLRGGGWNDGLNSSGIRSNWFCGWGTNSDSAYEGRGMDFFLIFL